MIKKTLHSLDNILFQSAYNDNYQTFVKNLFDYSSLINKTNHLGETVLHHVCFYGMIDKYYALVNMGANIEKTNQKNSLLHYASLSGKDNFLIVELIKLDILPNDLNEQHQTSVHFSANKQIANYLHLWCNRNKINILHLKDKDGNSVIHLAQRLGHADVIEYWLQQYPELNSVKNNQEKTWNELTKDIILNHKLI